MTEVTLERIVRPRTAIAAGLLFIGLHVALNFLLAPDALANTYVFLMAAPAAAFLASLWASWKSPSPARVMWVLLTLAIAIWILGMACSAWIDLAHTQPVYFASYADLIFFLYGVPILLAISLPRPDQRSVMFVCMDIAQAFVLGYLIYAQVFSVLPFSGEAREPLPVQKLVLTYDVENLVLALACSARLAVSPRGADTRQFFTLMSWFLWVYAVCATTNNHALLLLEADSGQWFDFLGDAPFLVVAGGILVDWKPTWQSPTSRNLSRIGLFVDTVSPSFCTLAIVSFAANVARTHYTVGICAIGFAVALYAVRGTIMQNRYAGSQISLRRAYDQLAHLSRHDALTGLMNRRGLDDALLSTWNAALRRNSPLGVLLVDVDYFKAINDTFGHRYGDECIVLIAHALRDALPRAQDLIGRYGGEEFVVVLPDTDQAGVIRVAERMRAAVSALPLQTAPPMGQHVTVSVGVCIARDDYGETAESLIQQADAALYRAKSQGRDRLALAGPHAVQATA
jgi:diguanylate cyclase (GGDEF)-like protein